MTEKERIAMYGRPDPGDSWVLPALSGRQHWGHAPTMHSRFIAARIPHKLRRPVGYEKDRASDHNYRQFASPKHRC